MKRAIVGRIARLALFLAVVAGALAFVLRTRGPEMASPAPGKAGAGAGAARGSVASASGAGYYILFRLARQRAEAQEEALLRGILNDAHAAEGQRATAAEDLAALARWAREESEVEQVLAGQGVPESAVVISNGHAMVVLPARNMTVGMAERIGTDLWNLAGIAPWSVLIRPRA
ncbi:MAG: SpoIIIAH-like family protein [Firmicutes bacterium]|nr:SpoIIIAH-like family protein [Bacillota bacterium]